MARQREKTAEPRPSEEEEVSSQNMDFSIICLGFTADERHFTTPQPYACNGFFFKPFYFLPSFSRFAAHCCCLSLPRVCRSHSLLSSQRAVEAGAGARMFRARAAGGHWREALALLAALIVAYEMLSFLGAFSGGKTQGGGSESGSALAAGEAEDLWFSNVYDGSDESSIAERIALAEELSVDTEAHRLLPTHLRFPPGSYGPSQQREQDGTLMRRCGVDWDIGPRGPVIVGGIGDSGTRGARLLVDALTGYQTCPVPGCNEAGDNVLMFRFTAGRVFQRNGRRVFYNATRDIPEEQLRDFSHHMCLGTLFTLMREDKRAATRGRWGWKAPHSIYYLPFFEYFFEGKLRFVHVIRDGRDVALGDNQNQYQAICGKTQETRDLGCDPKSLSNRLLFWALMNLQVFEYGMQVLGPDRYFVLRTEDFALVPDATPAVLDLLDFLGERQTAAGVAEAVAGCSGHQSSYGGNKYTAAQRASHLAEFGDAGRDALEFFGYKLNDWGVEDKTTPPYRRLLRKHHWRV